MNKHHQRLDITNMSMLKQVYVMREQILNNQLHLLESKLYKNKCELNCNQQNLSQLEIELLNQISLFKESCSCNVLSVMEINYIKLVQLQLRADILDCKNLITASVKEIKEINKELTLCKNRLFDSIKKQSKLDFLLKGKLL